MSLPHLAAPALAALPGVRHAFFTRRGGVSTGVYASLNGGRGSSDDPQAVLENRRRMTEFLGVQDGMLATPHQVHSSEVVVAFQPWGLGEAPQADALVTTVRGLAIGVATADCAPILFADATAGVIGAAHAGWKGALGGVLEATVEAMEKLGARSGSITAVLGPCIRQPSYEVGPEFVARFRAVDMLNDRFFAPAENNGHCRFDLGGYVLSRLRACGVGTIEDMALDTYPDEERFYSFRRTTHRGEADYGRLIHAITLEC
jgi:polyphenol oxidase